MTKQMNREEWLTALGESLCDDMLDDIASKYGFDTPPVRFSVGFSPRSKGGQVIGICCARSISNDGHNEIFISPNIDDSHQIAHVIVHELIHAYLDGTSDGHKNRFVKIAKEVGLKGPWTATTATPALAARLAEYIDVLGEIPASKVNLMLAGKAQTSRAMKVECTACKFMFRTSQSQIDRMPEIAACPVCDREGTLKQEIKAPKLQAIAANK